jgi:hypothetical protein
MDRVEKVHLFGLYISLKSSNASLLNEMFNEASKMANHYPEAMRLSCVLPPGDISIPGGASKQSLFNKVRSHISDNHSTAFLVNVTPHHTLTVDDAALLFKLSDFCGALGDYFVLQQTYITHHGQRKSMPACQLPFSHISVWNGFRMQQHSTQDPRIVRPSQTIQALPPSASMPDGRCNTVLVSVADGSGERMSTSVNNGEPLTQPACHYDLNSVVLAETYRVIQVRLVFSPVNPTDRSQPAIYIYGQFFKFSALHREASDGVDIFTPAPHIDMFLLSCHVRANGEHMGDIISLTDVRECVELVPRFGTKIGDQVNHNNSLEVSGNFYLNNFADKETFHAILKYQ